jgi:hypothetical protein
MNHQHVLLNQFIAATCKIDEVVVEHAAGLQISPDVALAIQSAKKLLPVLDDFSVKNRVVSILHDIYRDLRADIKRRGAVINGKKHPALDHSLQAYRIIIS